MIGVGAPALSLRGCASGQDRPGNRQCRLLPLRDAPGRRVVWLRQHPRRQGSGMRQFWQTRCCDFGAALLSGGASKVSCVLCM